MTANFNTFCTSTFTYNKKEDGKTVPHTTSLVDCNFSRLPASREFKTTEVYKLMHDLYINTCYATTVKGDGQQEKYARKVRESVKAWFAFTGIPSTTNNTDRFMGVIGVKKSTKTVDGEKQVDSALASESTFTKNALFASWQYLENGCWASKTPTAIADKAEKDSKPTVKAFDYESLELVYINQFGMSPEVARTLVEQAKSARA